jgi:23S rRNA pseudouridine2605 synthase
MDVEGDRLRAASARLLRTGDKHAWLEIVLDEGRNRQIRRLLETLDLRVLRLVRIAIGPVQLGDLAKGAWRVLDEAEVRALFAGY